MKASLPLAFICFSVALPSGTVQAAPPAPVEELLRFVPPDVSFCAVLRDLRSHAALLRQSPFSQTFRRSPLGLQLQASPELQQLEKAEQFLEKMLGLNLERIRDDILGDAVVFAYRPGPPGKPELEQGLILLRAREAKPLADLVERLNKIEPMNSAHLRDRILVFSGQEAMLREALALEKKTPAEQQSAIGKSLQELGAASSLAAVWVNPRSFDAELDARLKKATSTEEKAFCQTFLTCWKAIDAVAITLSLTKDLELGVTVRGRSEDLPRPVRRFLDEAALPADLWARFSDDALLAMAARAPANALLSFLGAFQSKEAFEQTQADLTGGLAAVLGKKDLMKEVLPHIGPDWGLSVSAPPTTGKSWFPSILFALRVAAGNSAPPIDRGLVHQLDVIATGATFAFNRMRKDPLVRHELSEGGLKVFYFANDAGQAIGLQPAFGLCDGYLVIASTPEAFKRFAATTPTKSKSTETPLLRVSLKHLREYLKDRRVALIAALAEQHRLPPQQVGQRLDDFVSGLGLFDRLELTQKSKPGQVNFTLRLKPTEPLRK